MCVCVRVCECVRRLRRRMAGTKLRKSGRFSGQGWERSASAMGKDLEGAGKRLENIRNPLEKVWKSVSRRL